LAQLKGWALFMHHDQQQLVLDLDCASAAALHNAGRLLHGDFLLDV
jgi:hypothetical protein